MLTPEVEVVGHHRNCFQPDPLLSNSHSLPPSAPTPKPAHRCQTAGRMLPARLRACWPLLVNSALEVCTLSAVAMGPKCGLGVTSAWGGPVYRHQRLLRGTESACRLAHTGKHGSPSLSRPLPPTPLGRPAHPTVTPDCSKPLAPYQIGSCSMFFSPLRRKSFQPPSARMTILCD